MTYETKPLPKTDHTYYPLAQVGDLSRLPMTLKILVEQMVRAAASGGASEADIAALAKYPAPPAAGASVPFRPTRILLQDFTGVPAAVDLAAMRSAMKRAGGDPSRIEPLIPVDLVIDHSVQADYFGAKDVYARNLEREYERNRERYGVLRWAAQAFKTFRVVPPGAGICHQVNLERLSRVVQVRDGVAFWELLGFTQIGPPPILRDRFTCAYCGAARPTHELSFDHVVPRSRGGRTVWSNVVTPRTRCNLRKSQRLPPERGM